jgi:antitoxin (DNA-binding transcriptional repressor) of toxin-antitoxin stability system
MGAISVEELVRRPARLIEEAESGQVAVVTKDGRPLFLAVAYDERLAKEEVHVVVAVYLYERGVVSLGRASKIAGLPLGDFIGRLGALKLPVVRYSPRRPISRARRILLNSSWPTREHAEPSFVGEGCAE